MEKQILELEEKLSEKYCSISDSLKTNFELLMKLNNYNLDSTVFSKAILTRLHAYYKTQYDIKELLGKRIATAG